MFDCRKRIENLKPKLWAAILVLALVHASSAHSESYVQRSATMLAKRCKIEKAQKNIYDCSAYIFGIIDTYFLYNQKCQIAPNALLELQVLQNVQATFSTMSEADLQNKSAALLVWQTVAKLNPCQATANATAPDKSACEAGFKLMNDAYSNNFTKQATLELLRNRGCLK